MLAEQPGREGEAEAAIREAITAGDADAWHHLGYLLAKQPGREGEAEAAIREAIAAGVTDAWLYLGVLLSKQPNREAEAAAAYREAIDSGATPGLRKRRRPPGRALGPAGRRGGRACRLRAVRARCREAVRVDLSDSTIARMARAKAAVARRPWALRLHRAIAGVICRLGPVLRSSWQQARRRPS